MAHDEGLAETLRSDLAAVPELREIAEGLDLDLPSSTRKDDLVKAIEAARAAASEADDQADDDE